VFQKKQEISRVITVSQQRQCFRQLATLLLQSAAFHGHVNNQLLVVELNSNISSAKQNFLNNS
jgi:hypothetical protein